MTKYQGKTRTNKRELNSSAVWRLILLIWLKRKENKSSGFHWGWRRHWKLLCRMLSNLPSAKVY